MEWQGERIKESARGLFAATPFMVMLLTALTALGQFASNIYLPALPAVARSLSVDMGRVQMTFTAFLAAFAFAQLMYGPLSDRFGRRPVLIFGILLYIAGSILCALAPAIGFLIAARILQAIGAAAGIVIARAVVRDVFDGPDLARVLALITIVFALVPGLTPLVGGILQDAFGWRAIFLATVALGLLVIAATALRLPESNLHPLPALRFGEAFSGYGAILKDPVFARYAVSSAFIIGAMSAFFAGSPAVYIETLGISATEYGFYPPLAVSGFIIGGAITRRLVRRVSYERITITGLAIMLVGASVMIGLPLVGLLHKHGLNLAIVIYVTGLGVFMPTAVAAALERFSDRAGSASAMVGFLQMAAGALSTAIVGVMQPSLPVLAFPAVMLCATVLGAFALIGKPVPAGNGR
ncbi:MAG: Bcr/CflA family efflux MFS transporter [Alphaproteobacteria bacterium]|nr:MAG: Bcr/CflA family efflux MFS transporter [Alphaproteobacteria bacterium]